MSEKDAGDDGVFNFDRIRSLIELMKEHDLGEIDLQQSEQRIKLARNVAPQANYAAHPAMPIATSAAPASSLPHGQPVDDENMVFIRSPMVGTFYSRANPNAADFVTIGTTIQADTQVCIIEAMKVFNEIPAEVRGKIVAILVKNEEAVDFGRPLFKVDTRS